MTAEELLKRYATGERDFRMAKLRAVKLTRAMLCGADLSGASLEGTRLKRANLADVNFQGSKLSGANLVESNLDGADLRQSVLIGTDLRIASLRSAILLDADFREANLEGADLTDADLLGAKLEGTRVNRLTYQRSSWTPSMFATLHRRGLIVTALDGFPEDAREAILGTREGLSLSFHTQLTPVDRFLVDGMIFGVLGKDTDCRVVEFKERQDTATVRLQAKSREDLETVAEALYRSVWEQQEHTNEQNLVKLSSLLGPREMLSDLRRRLDRMELHLEQQQAWRWDLGSDRLQLDRPIRLFISCAPVDEQYCHQLEGHLTSLRRQGVIESWHRGMIQPGQARDAETQFHLEAAEMVILLVSVDFMRSEALGAQMKQALARHASGQARLIPVLLRPIDLVGSPLEQFQALPEGGQPVTRWGDQDEAWTSVAGGIRRVVMSMTGAQKRGALPRY